PAFADSAVVLTVLTIPQFGSMSQYTSPLILAGMAKHRPFAYFALAEGVANLLLSVVLVQKIGLIGVGWGTVIPNLISSSIVVPLYTLRVLQLDLKEYLLKAYLRPVVSALPVLALGYRFAMVDSASWLTFAFEAVAICALFWATSYFVCFDGQQRAMATGR